MSNSMSANYYYHHFLVSRHVSRHVGRYVCQHVGHLIGYHVHLHVVHHVSHHVGHNSVILTLCEGSETLLEWKSEKV